MCFHILTLKLDQMLMAYLALFYKKNNYLLKSEVIIGLRIVNMTREKYAPLGAFHKDLRYASRLRTDRPNTPTFYEFVKAFQKRVRK